MLSPPNEIGRVHRIFVHGDFTVTPRRLVVEAGDRVCFEAHQSVEKKRGRPLFFSFSFRSKFPGGVPFEQPASSPVEMRSPWTTPPVYSSIYFIEEVHGCAATAGCIDVAASDNQEVGGVAALEAETLGAPEEAEVAAIEAAARKRVNLKKRAKRKEKARAAKNAGGTSVGGASEQGRDEDRRVDVNQDPNSRSAGEQHAITFALLESMKQQHTTVNLLTEVRRQQSNAGLGGSSDHNGSVSGWPPKVPVAGGPASRTFSFISEADRSGSIGVLPSTGMFGASPTLAAAPAAGTAVVEVREGGRFLPAALRLREGQPLAFAVHASVPGAVRLACPDLGLESPNLVPGARWTVTVPRSTAPPPPGPELQYESCHRVMDQVKTVCCKVEAGDLANGPILYFWMLTRLVVMSCVQVFLGFCDLSVVRDRGSPSGPPGPRAPAARSTSTQCASTKNPGDTSDPSERYFSTVPVAVSDNVVSSGENASGGGGPTGDGEGYYQSDSSSFYDSDDIVSSDGGEGGGSGLARALSPRDPFRPVTLAGNSGSSLLAVPQHTGPAVLAAPRGADQLGGRLPTEHPSVAPTYRAEPPLLAPRPLHGSFGGRATSQPSPLLPPPPPPPPPQRQAPFLRAADAASAAAGASLLLPLAPPRLAARRRPPRKHPAWRLGRTAGDAVARPGHGCGNVDSGGDSSGSHSDSSFEPDDPGDNFRCVFPLPRRNDSHIACKHLLARLFTSPFVSEGDLWSTEMRFQNFPQPSMCLLSQGPSPLMQTFRLSFSVSMRMRHRLW